MKEILPVKLILLMMKANKIAREHQKIIQKIDNKMLELGFDVEKLRNDDTCGYVDMIDYGRGSINLKELIKYKIVRE